MNKENQYISLGHLSPWLNTKLVVNVRAVLTDLTGIKHWALIDQLNENSFSNTSIFVVNCDALFFLRWIKLETLDKNKNLFVSYIQINRYLQQCEANTNILCIITLGWIAKNSKFGPSIFCSTKFSGTYYLWLSAYMYCKIYNLCNDGSLQKLPAKSLRTRNDKSLKLYFIFAIFWR